uniref:Orf292 n=1 Tax=Rhizophydium sp. 136 TaxID=60187 RepID=Q950P7_9FUNG|nr:orf292 [Rhizophydium sp. 136]AAK84261.1 orf292 [Rhizophydium sp. 136]
MKNNLKYWKEDLLINEEQIAYEINNKSGVYIFVCLINKKMYVGSSINLKRRLKTHLAVHSKELRSNIKLKNDKIKYGIKNFGFGILEYINTKDRKEIFYLEQKYLDELFKESKDLIYNISKDAIVTFATYNKGKGKLRSRKGENNPMFGRIGKLNPQFGVLPTNSIRVGLFDSLDNLIKEFKTKKEAYTELKKDTKDFNRLIEHKTILKIDGQLCYFKIKNNPNNIPPTKSIGRDKKAINVYDKNNNLLYNFESITETALKLNIPKSSIQRCQKSESLFKEKYFFKLASKDK